MAAGRFPESQVFSSRFGYASPCLQFTQVFSDCRVFFDCRAASSDPARAPRHRTPDLQHLFYTPREANVNLILTGSQKPSGALQWGRFHT